MKSDNSSALSFGSEILPSKNENVLRLYPYQTKKIGVIFVYGTDLERQRNIWFIPKSTQFGFIILLIFFNLSAILLYVFRKKMKLRGDGIISTSIDIMVAFTAGGNLRIHHKLERWFFGILLISAFFLTSIFMGDLLASVYSVVNKIHTFEQLAQINSPIFIHPTFKPQSNLICEMLRFESENMYLIELSSS